MHKLRGFMTIEEFKIKFNETSDTGFRTYEDRLPNLFENIMEI